jgi:hypothetical protein
LQETVPDLAESGGRLKRRKVFSAARKAAATQRLTILPSRQRLTRFVLNNTPARGLSMILVVPVYILPRTRLILGEGKIPRMIWRVKVFGGVISPWAEQKATVWNLRKRKAMRLAGGIYGEVALWLDCSQAGLF